MMNQNKFMIGIFALLLVVSFASANLLVSSNPIILNATSSSTNSTTFIITNNDSANWTGLTITSLIGGLSVSPGYSVTLSNNTSQTITLTAAGFTSNTSANLNITYNNGSSQSQLVPVNIKIISTAAATNFCDFGNVGSNLSITDFNINNNGEGDDTEWNLLDDLEIEVEVSNNGDNKISDVQVEIAIFSGNTDVTDDFDIEDTKMDLGSIKDDDEEVATFVINKIPADMEEGDYTVKVKTYVKGDENVQCKQDSESIQVTNPFGEGVIVFSGALDNLVEASAGQSVEEVSFDAINLGSSKEDEVLVTIYNKELGIDQTYHLSDLKSGDSEAVYFPLIEIPSNAVSKTYNIQVETYFDYDDGDVTETSSYDQNSYDDLEEDYNTFSFSIKVAGANPSDVTKPTLAARLTSDSQVGKEMTVEVSVKNNAPSQISTIITANNYDSWAELSSINSSVLTLATAETKTATLTFVPNKAGQQTFELTLVYNGKTMTQPVTVTVAEKSSALSSIFGSSSKNMSTYLITGIIILVVLIVVVLVLKAILSKKE